MFSMQTDITKRILSDSASSFLINFFMFNVFFMTSDKINTMDDRIQEVPNRIPLDLISSAEIVYIFYSPSQ